MAEMASDGPSPHSPSLRLGLPAPQPTRRHHAQSLLGPSFHDPTTSCSRILPRASRASLPPRWWAMTPHRLSLRPCTAPPSCMQPAAPPQVVAFESWPISAPICLKRFTFAESRKSDLWACVHVFTFSSSAFAFLIETKFSFKSLFAIWSLSPQRFHYYFCLSIVSWQYQKYSTILILVLCLLCVTPLGCSSYSSFAPSSPFFSSWLQKDCELFTHKLVLQCSASTSLRQPQTTRVFRIFFTYRKYLIQLPWAGPIFFWGNIYIYTLGLYVQFFKIRKTQKSIKSQNFATHSNVMFHSKVTSVLADSRIALLCHALRICVARAPTESCPFSLLVHWAFRACYRSHLLLLHHASLQQNWSVQTSIPGQPLWAPRWWCFLCCSLASSSFTLRKSLFLSDDRFLANLQCSHRVVLVSFCIIYSLHLIAVWFLQAIWLPEWSLQLPSFLAFYVSRGRAGRSNTSLRTLCFHFAVTWSLLSTCHMWAGWSGFRSARR